MDLEFRALDSFEPVAPEWDGLATRACAPPFLRPGWFQAWWNAFGRGRLEILTSRRGGTLVAVAPVYRHWGTLLAVANVHSPSYSFLADDAVALNELVERVFAVGPLHTSL